MRGHRRLPPPLREPPLRELLLRLLWPRELADRCDAPLEYPENASDPPPLRCVPAVLRVPSLSPRASALPVRSVRCVCVVAFCPVARCACVPCVVRWLAVSG